VTSGIVSAKQRRGLKQASPYQDFLQTDAAVNPGNSGGPLVNIRGQIVGINTAIVGQSYRGISFAIPSRTARDIYNQIVSGGKVARAWLGVGLQALDADEMKELGVTAPAGILVTRLVPNSPASLGGLRPGDVIVEWNGKPVGEAMELTLEIGRTPTTRGRPAVWGISH
jgi:serine protease Do